MAELATIARPYAEALFKATAANSNTTVVWLKELSIVANQPNLLQFAINPKATNAQIFDLMTGVMPSALPEAAGNFLRVLIENGRLGALPEIHNQYCQLKNTQTAVFDATVYSAFPLTQEQLDELRTTLEVKFKRTLQLSVVVQPELIGGIRVAVGDEVLDTSVQARLASMRVALTSTAV